MCQVLDLSEFLIFVNFRKYDRVLNMRRDAIMEEFWIFQDYEYTRFLPGLRIWQGCEYAIVTQGDEYA